MLKVEDKLKELVDRAKEIETSNPEVTRNTEPPVSGISDSGSLDSSSISDDKGAANGYVVIILGKANKFQCSNCCG